MRRAISKVQFDSAISTFEGQCTDRELEQLPTKRLRQAMTAALAALDITVQREWIDGDLVKGTVNDRGSIYVRRKGRWNRIAGSEIQDPTSRPVRTARSLFTDAEVDRSVKDGNLIPLFGEED